MRRPLIHQLTLLTAVLALVSIATGAFVTSQNAPAAPQFLPVSLHRLAGEAAVTLLLVVAVGIFTSAALRKLRAVAGGTVALGAVAGFTYGVPILHALVAQFFFASVACLALFTSSASSSEKGAKHFDAKRWPKLVPLATATPLLVIIQISLGVAYRHKAMGVMSHMGTAMLVALAVLGISVFVMQNLPENRAIGRAAALALTVTLIQLTLGVAVFVMGLLEVDNTPMAIVSAAAHVSNGALTLAASAILAIQIRHGASGA